MKKTQIKELAEALVPDFNPEEYHNFLVEEIGKYVYDPLGYVRAVYPWRRVGELQYEKGPRVWQIDILDQLGKHLQDPDTRYQPFFLAISSGHGIGKTALIAWLAEWGLSTFEDTKVIITANTDTQMKTKIKPEIDKWFRLSITNYWWSVNATAIFSKVKDHERTWRLDTPPWNANNPQAFAGLHNKGKRILIMMDEASEIDDRIWEVIDGATTDEGTEIIVVAFSQPTQNQGRFKDCFEKFAHRWMTRKIDSREVEGINRNWISELVKDWGEDSDYVRIRVRGEFPRVSWNQFISNEAVAVCKKFRSEGHSALPKIGSCDVARFGDDQTVIGGRQGRKAHIWKKYRGIDTTQTARNCMDYIDTQKPDAFVVDGDGIGGAVYDLMKNHGYDRKTLLIEFHGGAQAQDYQAYFNRRAEVWGLMRDAVNAVMELPDDSELIRDLTNPRYGFSNKQQLQLERKEDMKGRGLASPDCGDMLAMTFGVKVIPKPRTTTPRTEFRNRSLGWMS